jgi:hypothetical protein
VDLAANNAENKMKMKKAGVEEPVSRAKAAANATEDTKKYGQNLLDNLANKKKCPQDHAMQSLTSSSSWICNMCRKHRTENPRLRCAACDYDMCAECVRR